jgi:hypothetical protein
VAIRTTFTIPERLEICGFFSVVSRDFSEKELEERLAEAGLARAAEKQCEPTARHAAAPDDRAGLLSDQDVLIWMSPLPVWIGRLCLAVRMLAELKGRGGMVLMTSTTRRQLWL